MKTKRILIAEDEKCLCLSLEIIIEKLGHEPICTTNGNDTFDILVRNQIENTPIDLLLCDIQMPGMTGMELIDKMNKRKIKTPVLVITGYGDKEIVVRLMRMGCRDFMDKPFSPEQLEQRIKLLLDDINSREIENERLEFLARIGESARSFVHDINNALGTTYGYADMLMSEIPHDNPIHAHVSKIFKSASRAADICRELLSDDFTSLDSRNIPTDLNLLVERVSSLLGDVLPETIRIKTYGNRFPIWYKANARQLQQALLNLGFNAADAMHGSGEIVIEIIVHDRLSLPNYRTCSFNGKKCLSIAVSDSGRGIEPDVLPTIFETSYSTKSNGKGIGLPTVKRIVELHGGLIDVNSKPGQGTTFRMLFPLESNS